MPASSSSGAVVWRRTLWRDPVLLGMTVLTVIGGVLFFALDGHTRLQVQIFWALQPPLDAVFAVCSWRVSRLASGPPRRFWRILAVAGAVITIGDTFQAVHALVHPAGLSVQGTAFQSICLAAAQVAIVFDLLTHPDASRTRRERAALWLDSSTVLAGSAVVSWCLVVTPDAVVPPDEYATVIATGLSIVTGFAAIKVVLAGSAPAHRIAAVPMIASGIVMGGANLAFPPSPGTPSRPIALSVVFLASLLVSSGPRLQELLVRVARSPFGTRSRKTFSLLPYAAVLAAFGALLLTLPRGMSVRAWVVVVGVIVVTGLVVGRQLVAFQDNVRLIGRLDATLGELREHEGQLRDQAHFDGLTRLANRTHFVDEVARALAGDRGAGVSLLLLDLDDFKTVNDTMGHAAGDELLINVADRLRSAVRPTDVTARLGGDEFAVLLLDLPPAEAEQAARRILAGLAGPIGAEGSHRVVRASIGVAGAGPGDDMKTLLRSADIAMYAAKDAGKGSWMRYTDEMGRQIVRDAELARRLADALGADEFFLDYQPIFRFADGGIHGTEALLRWRPDPAARPVPPGEFIPVAEASGLIVPIGRWVLREACRQAGRWRREYPAAAAQTMGVNVAGRQLREPGFVAEVAAALAEAGLPAAGLSIEVTETAVLDDDVAITALHELRALGVKLALDDFGTAASSLGLLLTCPVTTLKLDRSFVEGVTTVDRQRAVAMAVSQIARALQLTTVAEGIETAEQANLLRGLGYDFAQGFRYARPMPPAEAGALWAVADVPAAGAELVLEG